MKTRDAEGPSYRGIKTDIAETKRTIKWLRERADKDPSDKAIKAELRQMEATLRHLEGGAKDDHEEEGFEHRESTGPRPLRPHDDVKVKARDQDFTITASRRSQITALRAELVAVEEKLLNQVEDGPQVAALGKEKDKLMAKISRLEKGGRVRGEDAYPTAPKIDVPQKVRECKGCGAPYTKGDLGWRNGWCDICQEYGDDPHPTRKGLRRNGNIMHDSSPVFGLTPVPLPSGERNEVRRAGRDASQVDAWRAVVTSDKTMLGGTKIHQSSLFRSRADAKSWAETIIDGNVQAGRGQKSDFNVRIVEVRVLANTKFASDAPTVTYKRAEQKPQPKPWYSNVFKNEAEQREAYRPRTVEEMKHAVRDSIRYEAQWREKDTDKWEPQEEFARRDEAHNWISEQRPGGKYRVVEINGAHDLAPVPVDDVEGYTDASGFHPISGTKGYRPSKTASGKGHGPKRKKKRARDTASTEQVLKSAGWKRVGGTGDSDDWERGQSGVTTFKTSDEWYFFLGGWDEGGRHGNGASQLASVIGRANDRAFRPVTDFFPAKV